MINFDEVLLQKCLIKSSCDQKNYNIQILKKQKFKFYLVIHDQNDDNEDVICDFVQPRKSGRSISRDSSVFPHTCTNEKLLRQRSQDLQGESNETCIFEMNK